MIPQKRSRKGRDGLEEDSVICRSESSSELSQSAFKKNKDGILGNEESFVDPCKDAVKSQNNLDQTVSQKTSQEESRKRRSNSQEVKTNKLHQGKPLDNIDDLLDSGNEGKDK